MSDELKPPWQWAAEDGITIMDPDGWRMKDAPSFDEPITRKEYSWRMAESTCRFGVPHPAPQPRQPGPRSELLWIGVDLDGTLAHPLWTSENPTSDIGEPIRENVSKLHKLVLAGYKPVIHTSRPWTDYEAIEFWLNKHQIPFKSIQCGKPLFALYVDDRGRHADAESWLP